MPQLIIGRAFVGAGSSGMISLSSVAVTGMPGSLTQAHVLCHPESKLTVFISLRHGSLFEAFDLARLDHGCQYYWSELGSTVGGFPDEEHWMEMVHSWHIWLFF